MRRKINRDPLKDRLSTENINFLEEEALRGKPTCFYGIIQRIEKICDKLKNYDSVKEYLKSLKEYKDKDKKNDR